jgi:cell wall-associated NlpC family hydrolase
LINFDDMIGKPYKQDGRGPNGFDCWGVCMEVCKRISIKLPEQDEIIKNKFKNITDPKLGDIVLIKIIGGPHAHVGVMLDSSSFMTVHNTGRRGVHRMKISHPWVQSRVAGFYRYVR